MCKLHFTFINFKKYIKLVYFYRLFVCPYIKLLNDYTNLEIICQPFLSNQFSIYVSHVETYNIVYIQNSIITTNLINELTTLMNLYYENNGKLLITLKYKR